MRKKELNIKYNVWPRREKSDYKTGEQAEHFNKLLSRGHPRWNEEEEHDLKNCHGNAGLWTRQSISGGPCKVAKSTLLQLKEKSWGHLQGPCTPVFLLSTYILKVSRLPEVGEGGSELDLNKYSLVL